MRAEDDMIRALAFALAVTSVLVPAAPDVMAMRPRQTPQPPTTPATPPPERETLSPAPARRPGEGLGPFKTLAIRGVMLIDGTGAPPQGPIDVIVAGNRISAVRSAGTPGVPLPAKREPKADHEIDGTGHYLLPGFVDMHAHVGGAPKNADAEYAYKLWLAHGVTTVPGVGLTGHALAVSEKARSEKNEIGAPRIVKDVASMVERLKQTRGRETTAAR